MSEYMFGVHRGHLKKAADKIAEKHGAWHTNYTDPNGTKRGWFSCPNRGSPFDRAIESAVLSDIKAAGGIDALTIGRR